MPVEAELLAPPRQSTQDDGNATRMATRDDNEATNVKVTNDLGGPAN